MKRVKRLRQMLQSIAEADGVNRDGLGRFRAAFEDLDRGERTALLRWMASELEVSRSRVVPAVGRLLETAEDDAAAWSSAVQALRRAAESPRRHALENLIDAPGGLELVLGLRAEVLEAQRAGERGLGNLDEDIADLLDVWCSHGLLVLEEIDRSSSFAKVQYLKERELVHPMTNLEEMADRLGRDRVCFALSHVAMPSEPVVFVEIALSRGLLRSIHAVIDDGGDRRPVKSPDTAVFYSINNTQNGLAGLGLGKVLVFRVIEALRREHPTVSVFATLSPIPGLWPRYLKPILEGEEHGFALTRDEVLEMLSDRGREAVLARSAEAGGDGSDLAGALVAVLSEPTWIEDQSLVRHLRKPLTEIAYLHVAGETDRRGKPLNPVAGFHLGNGATIAKKNVNFGANTSERGLLDSCGMMANYVYSTSTFETIGRTVRSLLPWGARSG
jgi:hypothetical protein